MANKVFATEKEAFDYFDKKYGTEWKNILAKITALQVDMSKIRQRLNVEPPAGLDPAIVARFKAQKLQWFKTLGYCDLDLAKVRTATGKISRVFQAHGK